MLTFSHWRSGTSAQAELAMPPAPPAKDATLWLHDRVPYSRYYSRMENRRHLSPPLHADHVGNRPGCAEAPSESRTRCSFRTRNCPWIVAPGAVDPRGCINFIELGKGLPFAPQRLFWLHGVAPGQWRGRHAHRRTELVLLALSGACRLHLDDGRSTDEVMLNDPTLALHIGTWLWHELTDFAQDCVILAIASTLYDEAEYLRD